MKKVESARNLLGFALLLFTSEDVSDTMANMPQMMPMLCMKELPRNSSISAIMYAAMKNG